METREYRNTIEKASWERGPWDNEPDKLQYPDEETGLPCLIVRGPMGSLCGYVGVADGHPYYGKNYGEDIVDADVHGGLTFAGFCAEHGEESQDICHVPGEGEPAKVWWLGYDCGHCFDLMPGLRSKVREVMGYARDNPEVYRDIDYVKGQNAHLARQLKDAVEQDGQASIEQA